MQAREAVAILPKAWFTVLRWSLCSVTSVKARNATQARDATHASSTKVIVFPRNNDTIIIS